MGPSDYPLTVDGTNIGIWRIHLNQNLRRDLHDPDRKATNCREYQGSRQRISTARCKSCKECCRHDAMEYKHISNALNYMECQASEYQSGSKAKGNGGLEKQVRLWDMTLESYGLQLPMLQFASC
jgi:hypothetical protein